jgi:uncharacterized membrane protein
MSQSNVITGSDSTPVYRVRKIGPADLKDALAKGLADFSAKPSHLVFLGLIYPLVGIGLVVGASRRHFIQGCSGLLMLDNPEKTRQIRTAAKTDFSGADNALY